MNETQTQQAWWDGMTPEQQEAYEDAQIRRRIERGLADGRQLQDLI